MGFDGIAVAGEEARDPGKAVPLATLFAMIIIGILYILSAVVLSLLVPWYDVQIDAPFPQAFAEVVSCYLIINKSLIRGDKLRPAAIIPIH